MKKLLLIILLASTACGEPSECEETHIGVCSNHNGTYEWYECIYTLNEGKCVIDDGGQLLEANLTSIQTEAECSILVKLKERY
jgi:hypothetical protein